MLTFTTFALGLIAGIVIPLLIGRPRLQHLGLAAVAVVGYFTGLLPLWAAVLIALSPVVLFLIITVYMFWLGRRALAGKMGEEQQWMAELARDDDTEFIEAISQIDGADVREIVVIANSKSELRELAIERSAEH